MAHQIQNKKYEKPEFHVPDGEYIVSVVEYEKGLTKKQQHTSYELKLLVEGKNSHLYDGLVLCDSMDWKTAAFLKSTKRFESLGDAVTLDESEEQDTKVLKGARGWARLGTEEYESTKAPGTKRKKNVVLEWLDKPLPASPEDF